MVIKELRGNFRDEYAMFCGYATYWSNLNLGNTVIIESERNENGLAIFKRFYYCLGVLKEGWKNGCKPFLGMDGCLLKGVCKGILSSAVGRDGNNQMYSMA